jgi:hypothetical protein
MSLQAPILIDGLSGAELLTWSHSADFQELVFLGKPVIFRAGTSEILGQFTQDEHGLTIVFSHIEGGGEGVLIKLMNLFRRYARVQAFSRIIWIVHAVDCPKPNPKLPRILEMKGFEFYSDPIDGVVYRKLEHFEAA